MSKARRQAIKRWRNGPEGKETTRITWYSLEDGSDIRLVLEDNQGRNSADLFPPSRDEAERIFSLFRMFSPLYSAEGLLSSGVIDRVKEYLLRNPLTDTQEADERASSVVDSVSSVITLGIVPTPGPSEPSDTLEGSTVLCEDCRGILNLPLPDKRLYFCECHPVSDYDTLVNGPKSYRYVAVKDPHAEQSEFAARGLAAASINVDGAKEQIWVDRLNNLLRKEAENG